MLKKIAYIGYGFVGKACHAVFEHNAEALIIDPKYSVTTINDMAAEQLSLTFVSINAPTLPDRSVDASGIYDVFYQLSAINYDGLVVLKSTLPPDIVDDLYVKYGLDPTTNHKGINGSLRYIYSPEFLRESAWREDALNPKMLVMAGNFYDCKELENIYKNHSHIKTLSVRFVNYKVASLVKYAINSYLANKVVFMNQLRQLYSDMSGGTDGNGSDWAEFIDILDLDPRIGSSHLLVPGHDKRYGYGGTCFPKDVSALIGFDKSNRLTVVREAELANTKIRIEGNK